MRLITPFYRLLSLFVALIPPAPSPVRGKRVWIEQMSQQRALFPGNDCDLGPLSKPGTHLPPHPDPACAAVWPLQLLAPPTSAAAASLGGGRGPCVLYAHGLVCDEWGPGGNRQPASMLLFTFKLCLVGGRGVWRRGRVGTSCLQP